MDQNVTDTNPLFTGQHSFSHHLMQRMRDEGLSNGVIARVFGISRQRVHAILGPQHKPKRQPPPRPSTPTNIAAHLLHWRLKHDLTQVEATELLGISASTTYSRWERGATTPDSPKMLLKHLELLDEKFAKEEETDQ